MKNCLASKLITNLILILMSMVFVSRQIINYELLQELHYSCLPKKKKLLMNSFLNAQFNYCPLTWMLDTGSSNNKIKHLHERCLRIIYNGKQSSYEELLIKDSTVSTYHRNIQTVATKRFKVKNVQRLFVIFWHKE